MTTITFFEYLQAIKASQEILDWVRGTKDAGDASDIYNSCVRGDWLLEIAVAADVDRRTIVRAACRVARTALRYVPEGEERPRKAIEAAERWCRGAATLEEVRIAGAAAWAAAGAAGAAAGAARAAARAAGAAWAAWAAAGAAGAAALAAWEAGAVWAESLERSAAIVREFIPFDVLEEGLLTVIVGRGSLNV